MPRTIIARLANNCSRDSVLKNAKNLKGSNIFINEDCSDGTAKARKDLYENMKTARQSGKIAFFRGKKLIVKERSKSPVRSSRPHNLTLATPTANVSTLVQQFTPNIDNDLPSPIKKPNEPSLVPCNSNVATALSPHTPVKKNKGPFTNTRAKAK